MYRIIGILLKRTLWAASIMWLMPYAAQAFSFGVPVIQSYLNEPLRIHLPIHLSSDEKMSQIFIEVAKPDVYKQWGLQQPDMDVSSLHLIAHQDMKNKSYVEIISYQPIKLAWISFILVAKKQQHRFYKQLKVMLDPASFTAPLDAYTLHENVAHLPLQKTYRTVQSTVKSRKKTIRVEGKAWARTWRYGPVRSGDSLSTIAYRLRKDRRYSNRSVMLALYRLNPKAFDQGNINHLKAGVFLDVPHEEALKVILSKPEALNELKFNGSKNDYKKQVMLKEKTDKLVFIGHISAKIDPTKETNLKHKELLADIATIQSHMDAMYKKNMASHIRMDGMDLLLNQVHKKMDVIEHQLKQVNQDQLALQIQVEQLSDQYDNPWLWRWGLLALLLLNALAVLFLYLHLKKKQHHSLNEADISSSKEITQPSSSPVPTVLTAGNRIDNHIYDAERAMDHGDYAEAEIILNTMQAEHSSNTRLSALNVRLYHEIGRKDERDAYVYKIRTQLNEMQWRVFCDHLPANVWQALVSANVVSGLSYEDDMEERLRDMDNSRVHDVHETPHFIVNKEDPRLQFGSMEDIGFEGIPAVASEIKDLPEYDLSEKSVNIPNTPILQASSLLENEYSKSMGITEKSEVTDVSNKSLSMNEHFNASDLSLDSDVELLSVEIDDSQHKVASSMDDATQENTMLFENESFRFEFDDVPLDMSDSATVTKDIDLTEKTRVENSDDFFMEEETLFFQNDELKITKGNTLENKEISE